ncbi:MAG: hypothetical protein AAF236_03005 [Verrucomicrobiota bacterium]
MSDDRPIPEPVCREEALRVWNLMKQNKPLSERDEALLRQSWEHQMWTHHGLRPKNGNSSYVSNTGTSSASLESTIVSEKDD